MMSKMLLRLQWAMNSEMFWFLFDSFQEIKREVQNAALAGICSSVDTGREQNACMDPCYNHVSIVKCLWSVLGFAGFLFCLFFLVFH